MKSTPFDTTKNISIIVRNPTRRALGSGAPTTYIPPKDGKMGVLIPSAGLLEQAEMDYLVEAETEKQKNQKRVTDPRRIQIEHTKHGYDVDIKEV